MKTPIHGKIRMIKNAPVTVFGYLLQKTDVIIYGKTIMLDKITALLLLL